MLDKDHACKGNLSLTLLIPEQIHFLPTAVTYFNPQFDPLYLFLHDVADTCILSVFCTRHSCVKPSSPRKTTYYVKSIFALYFVKGLFLHYLVLSCFQGSHVPSSADRRFLELLRFLRTGGRRYNWSYNFILLLVFKQTRCCISLCILGTTSPLLDINCNN